MTANENPRVFLDACCLINLFATDRIEEILTSLPFRFSVSRYVADHEVLRIESEVASEGPRRLSLRHLAVSGALTIEELATAAELTELIRFAAALDDGEASICALAVVHGGAVATDDRKALKILGEWAPSTPTLQTSELLHRWALENAIDSSELRRILRAIRDRARFTPGRRSPHAPWWSSHLR